MVQTGTYLVIPSPGIADVPIGLSNFASNQLAAAQFSSSKSMTPDDLLSMLMEESDRQRTHRQRFARPLGRATEERNEALVVGHVSKPKNKHADLTCYNCNEKGHISRFCQKPRCPRPNGPVGPGNGQPSRKTAAAVSGPATANAVESNIEDGGAWAAVELEELCVAEPDWFEMVGEGEIGGVEDLHDASASAFVIAEAVNLSQVAELYDSGCTTHISPYQSRFVNFTRIAPRTFKTANQQNFDATGKGDLLVDVPCDGGDSQLRLVDTLYSPTVGYTLVSIGQLDDARFTSTFGHGRCLLNGPDGEKVGQIAKNSHGVYWVTHDQGFASAVIETLTLMQLHCRLGHPSPQVLRDLMKNKMVKGIRLEYSPCTSPFFCESCVYAKATRKSVPHVREGQRASTFGEEVHTDLWEAPVVSRGGKKFSCLFIDDCTWLTTIYFLANKSDTFTSYRDYEAWVDTHKGARIKVLNSDRGGE
jgi:hypothetical protein